MSQRAIPFDLDDTLIFAYAKPEPAWHAVVIEFAAHLGPYKPTIVANVTAAFLSDDENRRRWRLQAAETRQNVVRIRCVPRGLAGWMKLPRPLLTVTPPSERRICICFPTRIG